MKLDGLIQALRQSGGFETVQQSVTDDRILLLGRIHPNVMEQWKVAMHRLLTENEKSPWKIDIAKHYFLRGAKVAYGWRLIIKGANELTLAGLTSVVATTPISNRIEVKEIAMPGAGPRNQGRVGATDTVLTGPMALRR